MSPVKAIGTGDKKVVAKPTESVETLPAVDSPQSSVESPPFSEEGSLRRHGHGFLAGKKIIIIFVIIIVIAFQNFELNRFVEHYKKCSNSFVFLIFLYGRIRTLLFFLVKTQKSFPTI